MPKDYQVFDFYRIFIGDTPPIFLLEIVFRTLIMYGYTTILLRLLGKRGMGQLSTLELAIVIAFGSAVGDPMVHFDVPVLHGMVAVTVVSVFQISLERLINKNKKVEAIMEGSANLVVADGVIKWDCLVQDNLSKEDLFRSLRGKEVQHLGQIDKAYFETSGQISVLFKSPNKIKPGLSVVPEEELNPDNIVKATKTVKEASDYCCITCGNLKLFSLKQIVPSCEFCKGEAWVLSEK